MPTMTMRETLAINENVENSKTKDKKSSNEVLLDKMLHLLKKVLIITSNYPPNDCSDGWFIRCYELSKFLLRQNYEVHVIYLQTEEQNRGYNLNYKNLYIYKIVREKPYKLLLKNTNFFVKFELLKKMVLNRFRWFELIDDSELIISLFYSKALQIIQDENIKNVIISSPSHSLQLVGLKLKQKLPKLNYIGDFRDLWSTYSGMYRKESFLGQKRIEYIEKKVLESQDKTLVVSKGMLPEFKEYINNIEIVENGFATIETRIVPDNRLKNFVQEHRKSKRIILGYFGHSHTENNGSSRQNVKNFFYFFQALIRNRNLSSTVAVVLQGKNIIDITLPEHINLLCLESQGNFQVRSNMSLIDVGLSLINEKSTANASIGGKVYDYIAENKPIWFITPLPSVSIDEVMKKYDIGFMSDVDELKAYERTLKKIIDKYESGNLKNMFIRPNEKKQFSRDCQYLKVIKHLK